MAAGQLKITRVTTAKTDEPYVPLPVGGGHDRGRTVTVHAIGQDVTIRATPGSGNYYTIVSGQKEPIVGSAIFYYTCSGAGQVEFKEDG